PRPSLHSFPTRRSSDLGIPCSKVHVVLPGANLDERDLVPSSDQLEPPPPNPLRLGFIGKHWQRKGLPFVLQVAEELARRGVGVRDRKSTRLNSSHVKIS